MNADRRAMMSTPRPRHDPPTEKDRQIAELRARWVDRYGPLVAGQLEPDRRYSLVRLGRVEFAYTSYDRYVRALNQAWSAGLTPESLPGTAGSKLLDVAPNLRAVDADLDAFGGPGSAVRSGLS